MPRFNLLEAIGYNQLKEITGNPERERIADYRKNHPEVKEIAFKQNKEYYDGDRRNGFGGYKYQGIFRPFVEAAVSRYKLNSNSRILIDRDEKGFLTFDFKLAIPNATIYGVHNSDYSINHAMDGYGKWAAKELNGHANVREQNARERVLPYLLKVDNLDLPFADNYFDTVISIHSICNFEENDCRKALRELIRVSKNNGLNSYIQNDSWESEHERKKLMDWVLICRTFLPVEGWDNLFKEESYNGDYGFVRFK